MIPLAISLYAAGFLLVFASVIIAVPITDRVLKNIEQGAAGIESFANEHLRKLSQAVDWQSLDQEAQGEESRRIEQEVRDEKRRRAKKLGITLREGVMIGGNDSRTIVNAVRQVGRANLPTACAALSGGFLSTVASIISLFP